MRRRPKIRGNGKIPRTVNRNRNLDFSCGDMNHESCYNYLLSATNNNPAVHQLFDLLNTDVKFNAVKRGAVHIFDLMEDNDTMGFFCGGSECGNYYGVGSCSGTCCGVGGLGIGCNFKLKNENREY